MNMVTRRLFLGHSAVAGAAATIITPAVAESIQPSTAEDRAAAAWKELCAALDEMMPTDGRLLIIGNHRSGQPHGFTVENHRTQMEQVHAKACIPVERSVEFARFKNGTWHRLAESRR